MLDTVIFDLDGTLLNTLDDLADSVNAALSKHNLPVQTVDEVRQFVGNGVRNLMIRSVSGGASHPEFEKILADFKAHYALHCMDKTAPYAGILELLSTLKERKIKLAVVSNKLDTVVKKLSIAYFGDLIPVAIGEKETVKKKPAPDSVFAAMEELGSDGTRVVYVGDSEVDIVTAENAGIPCVSVTWGFRDRAYLQEMGGCLFAEDMRELLQYLTDGSIG